MADPDYCTLLKQADAAYISIATGGSIREVQDTDGKRVVYNAGNRLGLLALIQQLQPRCLTYQSIALASANTRPTRFIF